MLKHLDKNLFRIEQSNDEIIGFSIHVSGAFSLANFFPSRFQYRSKPFPFWIRRITSNGTILKYWCPSSTLSETLKCTVTQTSHILCLHSQISEICSMRLSEMAAGKLVINYIQWSSWSPSSFRRCTWSRMICIQLELSTLDNFTPYVPT